MPGEAKPGAVAALDQLGAGSPPADQAQQLALLPEAEGVEALPAEPARTGGRPRGSRNKRTQEWVDYLLGQHGSPLEKLLRFGMQPLAEARAVLPGADAIEVWREQRAALVAALPYLHQQLPREVEVNAPAMPVVILAAPGVAVSQAALEAGVGEEIIDLLAQEEMQQNQALADIDRLGVERAELNGSRKASTDQSLSAVAPLITDQQDDEAEASDGEAGR